jgi:putative acetyltransferase
LKCMVNMKIYEVKERTELLMEQLLKVWEESVRATHQFLSEKEIEKIKEYVPQALAGV